MSKQGKETIISVIIAVIIIFIFLSIFNYNAKKDEVVAIATPGGYKYVTSRLVEIDAIDKKADNIYCHYVMTDEDVVLHMSDFVEEKPTKRGQQLWVIDDSK